MHAFSDDALGDLDATGVAEAIRSRRVAAVEVIDAALERAHRLDGTLNAWEVRDEPAARRSAAAVDRALDAGTDPGFFAGVPTAIKDNSDMVGLPTRNGCDAYPNDPRPADGPFVRLLRSTGAIPLGKSRMSEYGLAASAEHPRLGAVASPWDLERTAGASSSGAAALVAAGVLPFAHANDGGGSIRIPAAVNGLVGLKPTRGRLPLDALLRTPPLVLVANGVVTRSVRDTAAFLRETDAIVGNGTFEPVGDVTGPNPARLRIGMFTDSAYGPAAPDVRVATERTATLLESLGHRVDEVAGPLTAQYADDFLLYWRALAALIVRSGRLLHGRGWDADRLDDFTRSLAASFEPRRLPAAVRRLRGARRDSDRLYATYDVLLCPTLGHETPKLGHLDPSLPFETVLQRTVDWVGFTPIQNVTGEPAITLPLERDANGMPLGMMFGAATGRESVLLGLAYELERAAPWPTLAVSPRP